MANRSSTSGSSDAVAPASVAAPVTGIAKGGLGTAANLDDTQRYSVEDLRIPAPEPEFKPEPAFEPEPVAVSARTHVPAPTVPRSSRRPRGLVTAAAIGILAVAALLAVRDGGFDVSGLGGAGNGAGNGADAAGAFPSLAPIATPAGETASPEPGGSAGKGHGNKGGKGHD